MQAHLKSHGQTLWEYANGLENSPVSDCDFSSPVKSIGHGVTTPTDLKCNDDVWHLIFALSETVAQDKETIAEYLEQEGLDGYISSRKLARKEKKSSEEFSSEFLLFTFTSAHPVHR